MDVNATQTSHSQKTPLGLTIKTLTCESTEKLAHLVNFLKEHKKEKIIVFALTCAMVEFYGAIFKQLPQAKGAKVWTLHGKMKQNQRQAVLEAFTSHDAGALICTDVAARGLDIPDVHWILQLDPPQDPDAVVHRVGRTARMGRLGNALIFLLPHEEAYIKFLQVRKIPIQQADVTDVSEDLMPGVRKLSESDRDVLEKGIRAFVSYIRGYKEHQCKYIFQLKDLDLGKLAYACGLLQLPRMPEIRKLRGKVDGFVPSNLNPNLVEFKDKARQKARTKKLEALEMEKEKAEEGAQSKRGQKRDKPEKAKVVEQPDKRLPAAKRRLLEDRQDLHDFADEYTLLKRLKKGKITEEEFDQATGMGLDDEDEEKPFKKGGDHHQSAARGHKKSEKKFRKAKTKKANVGQRKGSKIKYRPKR